jgi:SAM-dependent MidA family methyltransferase
LVELIRREGPITFNRFMDVALYDPEGGYYTRPRTAGQAGPAADYQTSPQVHPIFGDLLAVELVRNWESIGRPGPYVVAELGAGSDELAQQILASLSERAPAIVPQYHAVELRPDPSGKAAVAERAKICRWPALDSLAAAVTGAHVVLSNEFFDALPVHRLTRVGGTLREIYVDVVGERFVERLGELSDPGLAVLVAHRPDARQEGWRGEVCTRIAPMLATIAGLLGQGIVLTIDYGFLMDDTPGETLLAYYRHQWNDQIYERVGEQDLTSHLDLTYFLKQGEIVGLEPVSVTTQREFLLGRGFVAEAEHWAAREPTAGRKWQARFAMAELIDPRGLGRLKVVTQRKTYKSEESRPGSVVAC